MSWIPEWIIRTGFVIGVIIAIYYGISEIASRILWYIHYRRSLK